jgi:hypothetical protein
MRNCRDGLIGYFCHLRLCCSCDELAFFLQQRRLLSYLEHPMTAERKIEGASAKKDYANEESILKISKEVAIKFIEMGRITPSTFDETFKNIHTTIKETVQKG